MSRQAHRIPARQGGALLLAGIAAAALLVSAVAQPPAAPPVAPTASGPILSFTATTEGVAGAPDSVRIDVLRWSTDAERDQLMAAWNLTGAGRSGRGGAGRGAGAGRGGRGGRGAAAPSDDPAPDPDAVQDPFGTFGLNARGGRGGRGAADAPTAPPPMPEAMLATALKQATTVGYLWSSEVAGYALRYAGKVSGSGGVDRIILITDRRLGRTNDFWTLSGTGTPSTYEFSVIELRVNAKGEGEGRISLTGKVAPDSAARIVTPENYVALPVVLKNVKRRPVEGH